MIVSKKTKEKGAVLLGAVVVTGATMILVGSALVNTTTKTRAVERASVKSTAEIITESNSRDAYSAFYKYLFRSIRSLASGHSTDSFNPESVVLSTVQVKLRGKNQIDAFEQTTSMETGFDNGRDNEPLSALADHTPPLVAGLQGVTSTPLLANDIFSGKKTLQTTTFFNVDGVETSERMNRIGMGYKVPIGVEVVVRTTPITSFGLVSLGDGDEKLSGFTINSEFGTIYSHGRLHMPGSANIQGIIGSPNGFQLSTSAFSNIFNDQSRQFLSHSEVASEASSQRLFNSKFNSYTGNVNLECFAASPLSGPSSLPTLINDPSLDLNDITFNILDEMDGSVRVVISFNNEDFLNSLAVLSYFSGFGIDESFNFPVIINAGGGSTGGVSDLLAETPKLKFVGPPTTNDTIAAQFSYRIRVARNGQLLNNAMIEFEPRKLSNGVPANITNIFTPHVLVVRGNYLGDNLQSSTIFASPEIYALPAGGSSDANIYWKDVLVISNARNLASVIRKPTGVNQNLFFQGTICLWNRNTTDNDSYDGSSSPWITLSVSESMESSAKLPVANAPTLTAIDQGRRFRQQITLAEN